ncbi:hypothetical protein [Nitrosovibrio sp. Nv6]|nr:hypothetical protein [Nitrosovibrio sp. Nv6]SEO62491.1 hypothetical protein SAMN05216316_0643 [Nitrosovibrio sp. Nv6]
MAAVECFYAVDSTIPLFETLATRGGVDVPYFAIGGALARIS